MATPPVPLPLNALLKHLTSGTPRLTMSQAISAASILIPAHRNSLAQLAFLTHTDMISLGIVDEDIRKGILALGAKGKKKEGKRKRGSDLDHALPDGPVVDVVEGDLDFKEILYVPGLMGKKVVVNRAPVMVAWCTIVAERLGFNRQEALSIAQVYTDLNSSSAGVARGILPASALKPGAGPSQPFVEIMGRKVPVLETASGAWRGLSKNEVVEPAQAFGYMQRAFRQQLGAVIGAMMVLADTFEPDELNKEGYGMYCDFRPESEGWGKKAVMECSTILGMRKEPKVEVEEEVKEDEVKEDEEEESKPKRPKLEDGANEFDGLLDGDWEDDIDERPKKEEED